MNMEEFYEEYGYEPDEQSQKKFKRKVQKQLKKIVLKKWLNGFI